MPVSPEFVTTYFVYYESWINKHIKDMMFEYDI